MTAGLLGHLRTLAGHSAVYGAADVLPQAVNFLLVPFFSRYLAPADYGVLALLAFLHAPLKIALRLGLDAGFFRIHYELTTEEDRRRLAGSVVLLSALVAFLVAAVLLPAAGIVAGLLSSDSPPPARLLRLVVADLVVGSFAVVPQALLRIQGRARTFTTLALVRHAANIALKIALLLLGWGVEGVLWSDLLSTVLFVLAQAPVLVRHATPSWSTALLARVLHFGLPKVPHGVLVQAQNLADRRILEAFVTIDDLGRYQVGNTFASATKFPISAFEQAWQPFVYAQVGRPDAGATLARVGTYFFALFTAGALAVAMLGGDALVLLTPPSFHAAASVVPVVALAYLIHGFFLLTSVGIGIEKKARYYPLITLVAASTNVAANFALIPAWGFVGAAWATVLSYAVMAALGFYLSQRLYPLPLEWSRYTRLAAAAAATYGLSRLAPAPAVPAIAAKAALLAAFPLVLWLLRFWTPAEIERVRRLFK